MTCTINRIASTPGSQSCHGQHDHPCINIGPQMVNHKEWASAELVMAGLPLYIGEGSFLEDFVSEADDRDLFKASWLFFSSRVDYAWVANDFSRLSLESST
jgi:hypothetical protein